MGWRLAVVVACLVVAGVTLHRFWPQDHLPPDLNDPGPPAPSAAGLSASGNSGSGNSPLGTGLSGSGAAAAGSAAPAGEQEEPPDFIPGDTVRVRPATSGGAGGDVLVIYHKESAQGEPLPREQWKRSFEQLWSGRSVKHVAPWSLPSDGDNNTAILVTLENSGGNAVEFVILALGDDGRFSQALHAASIGAGERPLEVADVDNDGRDEVIVVPQYQAPRRGYSPEDGLWRSSAQVWKWNPRHRRYEMVNETSYRRRLKPI